MNKNDQQYMAQKIRAQYMEKQTGELDELSICCNFNTLLGQFQKSPLPENIALGQKQVIEHRNQ